VNKTFRETFFYKFEINMAADQHFEVMSENFDIKKT